MSKVTEKLMRMAEIDVQKLGPSDAKKKLAEMVLLLKTWDRSSPALVCDFP